MQLEFLKELKEIDNYSYTENGAVALKSTGNKVLDAFGSLGGMQKASVEDILRTFYAAFYQDPTLTMRLLFYIRDIRGGQGMRRVFRVIIRSLAFSNPKLVINNFDNFLFFGRGDDLLCLFGTPVEKEMSSYIYNVLSEDLTAISKEGDCSLMAKWMPSINASSKKTRKLALAFIEDWGISKKLYRVMLSTLRTHIDIVEKHMSANEWEKINFEKLPSKAAMIYSDTFVRHCFEQYLTYLKALAEGNTSINAGALFPVNIIDKALSSSSQDIKNRILYNALWEALPNYFENTEETGICVVDTSGSMFSHGAIPIKVALSLGLYCADKAKGPFANHFITFSRAPVLQEIVGENIFEKIDGMQNADWAMNTNLEAVFNLILKTAIINHSPQSDLPSKLYIISDMQFDDCTYYGDLSNRLKPQTFIETMREKYAEYGYQAPALIFWNVAEGYPAMFQLKETDGQCCMVSGYSPSLFKSIIEGTIFEEEINDQTGKKVQKQKIDPLMVMQTTLLNKRYDRVVTE